MSDPVSILSFYFALIGFISGIFFTRLDNWYGEIRSKRAILERSLINDSTNRNNFINLGNTLVSLKSSSPFWSYVAIGVFITSLGILGIFIPLSNLSFSPFVFLYGPVLITVLAYWIGGGILLLRGRCLINKSLPFVESKITGEPLSDGSLQRVATIPDPRINPNSDS